MNPPGNRKSKTSVPLAPANIQHSDYFPPGMTLQREYKGKTISVKVLDVGFSYNGERFKSLTAVAQAITGKHWNGFHFFNLRNKGCK